MKTASYIYFCLCLILLSATGQNVTASTMTAGPDMVWSTYIGGADSNDIGWGITTDAEGSVYIVGGVGTWAAGDFYPVTPGAYDTVFSGSAEAFVTKFNANGEMLWSTYLGGSGNDYATEVVADSDNNIYVSGYTYSSDFPTTPGAHDTTFNGGYTDVYIAKFDTDGGLVWSTYIGGSDHEAFSSYPDLAIDSEDNVYIVGTTKSSNYPTTPGAYDTTFNESGYVYGDAFVSKFDKDGGILWSTFLGSSSTDEGLGVGTDNQNNVYIVGKTYSANFPTTPGLDTAKDSSYAGFVTKFDADGALLWSTFHHGSGIDECVAVASDSDGNAYVAGYTESSDFPVTGGYDLDYDFHDCFLTKFDEDGNIVWSTFHGGTSTEEMWDVTSDWAGNIYMAGETASVDFPIPGGDSPLPSSYRNVFISRINDSGALVWSTVIGGTNQEKSRSVVLDNRGNLYATGHTSSSDFPVLNGYDESFNGSEDTFLLRMSGFPAIGREAELIELDVSVERTAPAFDYKDFQLDLEEGDVTHLKVQLSPILGPAEWLLIGQYGALPELDAYHWMTETPTADGNYEILIPFPAAGSYYFTVYYKNWGLESGTFSMLCTSAPAQLISVSPDRGGNAGETTVTITGLGPVPENPDSFELRKTGESSIPSEMVYTHSPTEWQATFDLNGAAIGTWSLAGQWSGESDLVLDDCFEVTAGVGPRLAAWLTSPVMVRADRNYTVQIHYENRGDSDLKAPLFIVKSDPPVDFRGLCDYKTYNGEIQMLGVNHESLSNVLPHGYSNTIPVKFRSPTSPSPINFTLEIQYANNGPIDWDGQEANIQPVDPPLNWSEVWAALKAEFGVTWGEYLSVMSHEAERHRILGMFMPCVDNLIERLYRTAIGAPDHFVSGRLYSAETGASLPLVRLILREDLDDPEEILDAWTTAPYGQVVFDEVPPGTYELFAEGYYFDPPMIITVTDDDVVGLDLPCYHNRVVPEIDAAFSVPQSDPVMVSGSDSRAYLLWGQENDLWSVSYNGTTWSVASAASDTLADQPALAFCSDLGDYSASPGMCLVFREGDNNEAHLRYALGVPDGGGEVQWTVSTALTSDAYGDYSAALAVSPGGEAIILWLQHDWAIADDDDLYYQTLDFPSVLDPLNSSRSVPLDLAGLLRTALTDKQCATINFAEGIRLPSWLPCIGGKYKISVEGSLCFEEGCNIAGDGNLTIILHLSDNLSGKGAAIAAGKIITKQKPCRYVFDQASVGLSIGAEGKIPAPPVWMGDINLWGLIKIKWGVLIGGNVSGSAIWKGAFPGYPNAGSIDFVVDFGPFGEICVMGDAATVEVTGTGELKWGFELPFKTKWLEINFKFKIQANGPFGLKYVFERSWPAIPPVDDVLRMYGDRSFEEVLAEIIFSSMDGAVDTFIIETESFAGTGNVYEGLTVLSDISGNYQIEGKPSVARSGTGEILATWILDSVDPETQLGAQVLLASYNGSGFDAPVELHPVTDLNRKPCIIFDSNNDPMVVYSSSLGTGLDSSSLAEDILNAISASNIYYTKRTGSTWSAPALLADVTGRDEQVSLAAGASGQIIAVWENVSDGNTAILASVWNGSAWSAVSTLSTGLNCNDAVVAYAGGYPVAVWIQDEDEDPDTVMDQSMYFSKLDGTWSAAALVPVEFPATPAESSDVLLARDILAQYAGDYASSDRRAMPTTPPPECCTDDETDDDLPDPPLPPPGPEIPDLPPGTVTQPWGTEPGGGDTTGMVVSIDPNEKVGPEGVGPLGAVSRDDTLTYTIFFENLESASAAAQEVVITDDLDPDLDYSTFRFLEIGVSHETFAVSSEELSVHIRDDWPDWLERYDQWWIDIEGELDPATGRLECRLQILDPVTGELPSDIFAGLLPPDDETGRGEGHITYSIKPKYEILDGTELTNYASIVFDTNEPIVTNEVSNIIGGLPPEIALAPVSRFAAIGENVQFCVDAVGDDLEYVWKKDTVPIPGAVTACYAVMDAQVVDEGTYCCTVSNLYGTEDVCADLSVYQGASITSQPQSETVCAGLPAQFCVTATGDSLTYKWYKNGVEIPGAVSDCYDIGTAAEADEGAYRCYVGSTAPVPEISDEVTLTVNSPFTWDPAGRFAPGEGEVLLEWNEAVCEALPATYHVYVSTTPGGQNFSSPDMSVQDVSCCVLGGLTNGTPYYVIVRVEDSCGNTSANTDELVCVAGGNMISSAVYNCNFEGGVASTSRRGPTAGKPAGWTSSSQDYGDKTTAYYVDDTDPYEGSYCALMETSGTPVDPADLSIASLTSDNSFALAKNHTYSVSAAVKRSDSQWTRFILFSAGFTLIHTESYDALDDQSGDSGWEILYFTFRAPIALDNAFVRIDSIVTNGRTASGPCSMWIDDVQIVDLGEETYADIYNITPPPPQYGVRNRYFDMGTETEVSTKEGTVYTCLDMPKRWNIAMAVDVGSNDTTGYPVWGQETPGGLSNVSGNAGYVKAKAADTFNPAWPALGADGVRVNDVANNGVRHVLSFDYGAAGATRPLLRTFMISNTFSHYASLFVDPAVPIPGNKMWNLTLQYVPEFGDSLILVRFDNVTLGASGSGPHTDETTVYVDNVWMGTVME